MKEKSEPRPMRPRAAGRVVCRLVAAVGGLLCAAEAAAHDFTITDTLVLLKTNQTIQVDLTIDLDALVMGVPPRMHSPEMTAELERLSDAERAKRLDALRRTLRERFQIEFDGRPVAAELTFPDSGATTRRASDPPSVFGVTARFTGPIPENAAEFALVTSPEAGVVYLTILHQPSATGAKHVLAAAARSPPFRLDRDANTRDDARSATVARYLALGFEHILPLGLDHILFVLGLFLLSTRLRPLLWQVSAFTVAHTLTLALSMYGVVQLPPRLVEPLIALSIAYVAVENLCTSELKPWRPALVFGFGLLHGMGFAGVLRELGLPRGEFVPALISFNVGVEAGQLAVIGAAFLLLGWFRKRSWYRRAVVVPASLTIAAVGGYWAVTRALYGA